MIIKKNKENGNSVIMKKNKENGNNSRTRRTRIMAEINKIQNNLKITGKTAIMKILVIWRILVFSAIGDINYFLAIMAIFEISCVSAICVYFDK